MFPIELLQGANMEIETYPMRLDADTCEADNEQQHQEPLPYLSLFKLHLHKTLDQPLRSTQLIISSVSKNLTKQHRIYKRKALQQG